MNRGQHGWQEGGHGDPPGPRPQDHQYRPHPGPPGPHGAGRGPSKYDKIAAARRESNAALRKRQVSQLDIADSLVSARTQQIKEDVLAAPPYALTPSSFDERLYAPRALLYPVLVPQGEGGAVAAAAAAAATQGGGDEGGRLNTDDLLDRLKDTTSACLGEAVSRDKVWSKHGGTFNCRPGQIAIAHGNAKK